MKLSKKIIFQADDFGYNNNSTHLMLRLKKEEKIINFSVIPNLFKVIDGANLITSKEVAAHINLIEGKPISRPNEIASLVDKKGNFYPLLVFIARLFLGRINLKEIYKEIESQINFLQKKGAVIVELNSHQHLHALSPIANIFFDLAQKNNIKIIRSYKNIYSMTTAAKIKYFGLKMLAYISEIIFNKKLRLPRSWMINDEKKTIFMSWESKNFQFDKLNRFNQFKVVIHPGLPFDNNQAYLEILNK